MTVDYNALKTENIVRYGTDIGRIGQMLLANRYDKRTHFIYELIQNAEDALRRRPADWDGRRSVTFDLTAERLVVSHFGRAFDEFDVRGVCGIDESTKDLTSIGRFGIGFKSVYSFTKRPEIHSENEAFAIETYVLPIAVEPIPREMEQTKIVLPLAEGDAEAQTEIVEGLKNLGARTLLFLRNVNEISWTVEREVSGLYFRDDPVQLAPGVREIGLMGQQHGEKEVDERWLVFSKPVESEGRPVGNVEIAFALSAQSSKERKIEPLADSTLVVFFPTILSTNTGFLLQGPYRTTPSRDNIPINDSWNKHLVKATGILLVDALRWLRDERMLDVGTLRSLPLERERFAGGLLEPLFDHVVDALKHEALLPCTDTIYTSAQNAQLSRTNDLRDLFNPTQLGELLRFGKSMHWLSSDITADRTPTLRQYLLRELNLSELTPESLLPRLNAEFLQAQSDEWIVRLYEFLNNVPAVAARLKTLPLVRLEDGKHVPAFLAAMPQAFFPSQIETGFPIIRKSVCQRSEARAFLQSLGLTTPDPVDDVVRNLLPIYQRDEAKLDTYTADLARILRAFKTDSAAQRQKLVGALESTAFVLVKEMKTASLYRAKPRETYVTTNRLRDLYDGIPGIYLVDDRPDLRGEPIRELLEACGSTRYICPVEVPASFTESEKRALRHSKGQVQATSEWPIKDHSLRGLEELLDQLSTLDVETRRTKSRLLWEALIELQDRRGEGIFTGTYRWQYYQVWTANFDARFVRLLNEASWIPDINGDLTRPSLVLFETTGWLAHPFLESKIRFKKPVVEELAKEAGFEPGMLNMLIKLGVTSTAELMALLKVDDHPVEPPSAGNGHKEPIEAVNIEMRASEVEDAAKIAQTTVAATQHDGDAKGLTSDDVGDDANAPGEQDGHDSAEANGDSPSNEGKSESCGSGANGANRTGTPNVPANHRAKERTFVSYIAMHPEEDESAPDSQSHQERLKLEAKAIALICAREPLLKQTPAGNAGFDLIEADANDEPERWIEVKAMKESLEDRPVGISSAQFEFARQHGEQFWLYVVEYANDPDRARIVKIRDPVGKAGTFTFDKGWSSVAE